MTFSRRPFRTLALIMVASSSIISCDPPIDPELDSRIVAQKVAGIFESAARAMDALESDGPPPARGKADAAGLERMAARLLGAEQAASQLPTGLGALRQLLLAPATAADGALELRDRRQRPPRTLARRSDPPAASDDIAGSRAEPPSLLGAELRGGRGTLSGSRIKSAQEVRRAIEDRLLAQANLESATGTEALYRLRPEVTCADPDDGRLEPDCESFLRKVELRLRMSRDGQDHVLDILVGPQKLQPVTLQISEQNIAATADLDRVKTAVAEVSRTLDEPDPGLPTVMRGRVTLTLGKEGTRTASLALGFRDMIEIRDDREGGAFRTVAADPALVVRADGEARQVTSRASIGLTEVVGPLDDYQYRPTPSPDLRVVVAGLTGEGLFDLGKEEITLRKIGLGRGASFAEVRGNRVVELNLNAGDDRVFDAAITFTPEGLPRLALSPRFDLGLMFKLGLIASELSSPPPAHLLDESYRLLVDAADGQAPVLEAREHADGGGVRIVSGQVTLSSNRAEPPVKASAGQCLYPRDPAPGDHPVLGAVTVTSCSVEP
jgi:hypothetical protein